MLAINRRKIEISSVHNDNQIFNLEVDNFPASNFLKEDEQDSGLLN